VTTLVMCGVVLACLAGLGRAADPVRSKPPASHSGGTKHLLLESDLIDRTSGVRLVLGDVRKDPHNPLFVEDKPWEPRFDNLYANVVFDEESGIYKCWYSPFTIDEATAKTPVEKREAVSYVQALKGRRREMGVCYAVSNDGIAWTKPELGIVAFNGSTKNNLVLRGPHGAGVMKDLRDPDPRRRYKMFCKGSETGAMSVVLSPDGLRWSEVRACPEMQAVGDTHNNCLRDARGNGWIGITRLWADGQRIVGRAESTGFAKWTKAVEVLRGDPDHQTYAMPVFRYANVYLGLVMIFHTKEDLVDCELAWSRDTIRWERVCPGRPLIPRGPRGSFDWGCIYGAAYPVVRDGEIRLYYGGSDGPHTAWRSGGFGLARLRPDGFAGMQTADSEKMGTVVTRAIECTGRQLRVSADVAAGGSLRAAVLGAEGLGVDDCEPITTNVTDGLLRWRGGRDLTALRGQQVRLRFELRSCTLYSFSLRD